MNRDRKRTSRGDSHLLAWDTQYRDQFISTPVACHPERAAARTAPPSPDPRSLNTNLSFPRRFAASLDDTRSKAATTFRVGVDMYGRGDLSGIKMNGATKKTVLANVVPMAPNAAERDQSALRSSGSGIY